MASVHCPLPLNASASTLLPVLVPLNFTDQLPARLLLGLGSRVDVALLSVPLVVAFVLLLAGAGWGCCPRRHCGGCIRCCRSSYDTGPVGPVTAASSVLTVVVALAAAVLAGFAGLVTVEYGAVARAGTCEVGAAVDSLYAAAVAQANSTRRHAAAVASVASVASLAGVVSGNGTSGVGGGGGGSVAQSTLLLATTYDAASSRAQSAAARASVLQLTYRSADVYSAAYGCLLSNYVAGAQVGILDVVEAAGAGEAVARQSLAALVDAAATVDALAVRAKGEFQAPGGPLLAKTVAFFSAASRDESKVQRPREHEETAALEVLVLLVSSALLLALAALSVVSVFSSRHYAADHVGGTKQKWHRGYVAPHKIQVRKMEAMWVQSRCTGVLYVLAGLHALLFCAAALAAFAASDSCYPAAVSSPPSSFSPLVGIQRAYHGDTGALLDDTFARELATMGCSKSGAASIATTGGSAADSGSVLETTLLAGAPWYAATWSPGAAGDVAFKVNPALGVGTKLSVSAVALRGLETKLINFVPATHCASLPDAGAAAATRSAAAAKVEATRDGLLTLLREAGGHVLQLQQRMAAFKAQEAKTRSNFATARSAALAVLAAERETRCSAVAKQYARVRGTVCARKTALLLEIAAHEVGFTCIAILGAVAAAWLTTRLRFNQAGSVDGDGGGKGSRSRVDPLPPPGHDQLSMGYDDDDFDVDQKEESARRGRSWERNGSPANSPASRERGENPEHVVHLGQGTDVTIIGVAATPGRTLKLRGVELSAGSRVSIRNKQDGSDIVIVGARSCPGQTMTLDGAALSPGSVMTIHGVRSQAVVGATAVVGTRSMLWKIAEAQEAARRHEVATAAVAGRVSASPSSASSPLPPPSSMHLAQGTEVTIYGVAATPGRTLKLRGVELSAGSRVSIKNKQDGSDIVIVGACSSPGQTLTLDGADLSQGAVMTIHGQGQGQAARTQGQAVVGASSSSSAFSSPPLLSSSAASSSSSALVDAHHSETAERARLIGLVLPADEQFLWVAQRSVFELSPRSFETLVRQNETAPRSFHDPLLKYRDMVVEAKSALSGYSSLDRFGLTRLPTGQDGTDIWEPAESASPARSAKPAEAAEAVEPAKPENAAEAAEVGVRLGTRVMVRWGDGLEHTGIVSTTPQDTMQGQQLVKYIDGDEAWHDMRTTKYRVEPHQLQFPNGSCKASNAEPEEAEEAKEARSPRRRFSTKQSTLLGVPGKARSLVEKPSPSSSPHKARLTHKKANKRGSSLSSLAESLKEDTGLATVSSMERNDRRVAVQKVISSNGAETLPEPNHQPGPHGNPLYGGGGTDAGVGEHMSALEMKGVATPPRNKKLRPLNLTPVVDAATPERGGEGGGVSETKGTPTDKTMGGRKSSSNRMLQFLKQKDSDGGGGSGVEVLIKTGDSSARQRRRRRRRKGSPSSDDASEDAASGGDRSSSGGGSGRRRRRRRDDRGDGGEEGNGNETGNGLDEGTEIASSPITASSPGVARSADTAAAAAAGVHDSAGGDADAE